MHRNEASCVCLALDSGDPALGALVPAFPIPRAVDLAMQWTETELPQACHFRELASFAGDSELKELPVKKASAEIEAALQWNSIVAVKATTGSGKSVVLPELLLKHINAESWKRPGRAWPGLAGLGRAWSGWPELGKAGPG